MTEKDELNYDSIEKNLEKVISGLDELEMTCQAQLGIIGISYKGNLKPCNLTEDFFTSLKSGVVVKFDKTQRYSDSLVLSNVNIASNKVINLLKDNTISNLKFGESITVTDKSGFWEEIIEKNNSSSINVLKTIKKITEEIK